MAVVPRIWASSKLASQAALPASPKSNNGGDRTRSLSLFPNASRPSYGAFTGLLRNTKESKKRHIVCSMIVQVPPKTRIPPPFHPNYDLNQIIDLALSEDAGNIGDITCQATIPESTLAEAKFLAKQDGILAGVSMAEMVFRAVDPDLEIEWALFDGERVRKGDEFGVIKGKARSILIGERVALNFMQRMSGIATITNKMVEAAKPALILETRKTVPGLRLTDKWAVLIGGGNNHRMGLFDMVLIKDNHIAAAGGIRSALSAVEDYLSKNNLSVPVEIEARTLDEVKEVMACMEEGISCVTRIMLDNMVTLLPQGELDVNLLQEAVNIVDGKLETEASGNVTLETVNRIGATGVTFISSGALTHSVKALDISLNIDTELAVQVTNRSLKF